MDTEETFFLALKTHRESKSIKIDEISDYTKINPKYLKAIEEGEFDIIPNIYMRLFIRSYAKYIDADYKQALVDYELYTTGKIQPKFFETDEDISLNEKKTSMNINNGLNDDFQINYKQIITIIITIIAIYSGFKLIEYISTDTDNVKNEQTSSSTSISNGLETSSIDENNNLTLDLLTNQDFKNGDIAYQITEIIPTKMTNIASLEIKTLNKTKINIMTYDKNGSIFF